MMGKYVIDNRPTPVLFECGNDLVARTIQNAKNLLMTEMGEVPYDRYRGFDASLYDLPIGALRERLLPEIDRVMLWEPDVEVLGAECTLDENSRAIIEVTLTIGFEG